MTLLSLPIRAVSRRKCYTVCNKWAQYTTTNLKCNMAWKNGLLLWEPTIVIT